MEISQHDENHDTEQRTENSTTNELESIEVPEHHHTEHNINGTHSHQSGNMHLNTGSDQSGNLRDPEVDDEQLHGGRQNELQSPTLPSYALPDDKSPSASSAIPNIQFRRSRMKRKRRLTREEIEERIRSANLKLSLEDMVHLLNRLDDPRSCSAVAQTQFFDYWQSSSFKELSSLTKTTLNMIAAVRGKPASRRGQLITAARLAVDAPPEEELLANAQQNQVLVRHQSHRNGSHELGEPIQEAPFRQQQDHQSQLESSKDSNHLSDMSHLCGTGAGHRAPVEDSLMGQSGMQAAGHGLHQRQETSADSREGIFERENAHVGERYGDMEEASIAEMGMESKRKRAGTAVGTEKRQNVRRSEQDLRDTIRILMLLYQDVKAEIADDRMEMYRNENFQRSDMLRKELLRLEQELIHELQRG